MSPLAPPESGNQSFNRKPDVNQHNLIERDPNEKFTYSMGALYGMRHRDRRAPNLGNRFLLESISRSSDAILSVHSAGGTFSQSITSSTMDRLQRDRRQLNQNRPAAVPPRHNRNASSDGQTRYRDERQRQSNHGKIQIFFFYVCQSFSFYFVRLCSTNTNACCCNFFFFSFFSFYHIYTRIHAVFVF